MDDAQTLPVETPVLSARLAPWWTVALVCSIAFADALAPLEFCVPLLYVLPVLVASWTLKFRSIVLAATACSLLTLTDWLLSGARVEAGDIAVANRVLALVIVWTVALMRISQLRQERFRRQWAAVAVASRDAIIAMDLEGGVREWNARASDLYGHAAEDVVGHRVDLVVVPRDAELLTAVSGVRQGRIREPFQDTHRTSAGVEITVSITLSPVLDGHGALIGVSATVRDVTAQVRAQRALAASEERHRQLSDELDRAAQQKDAFIAMLGHELRNPLGAISNAAGVLRMAGPASGRGERALEILDSQVSGMRRQLDDLLDLSRLARGEIKLKREAVTLLEIVTMAVDSIREHLRASGLDLHVADIDPGIVIEVDKFRLGQVLHNLLDNARKFTESGGAVRIEVTAATDAVEIAVIDNGLGIEPELLPHIFEEFAQAEQSLSRQTGGMGLGLAIVKQIIDLHDGTVRVASNGKAGQGSCVTFVLPRMVGEAEEADVATEPRAAEASGRAARHIMIADDNVEALQALSDYLELNGFLVTQAIDGESVLNELEATWPDVLVLDIGLPGRDGFEVAREVRSRWPDRSCTLIAVTGYGSAQVSEQATVAGFDHFLVKPVALEELRQRLR